MNTKINIKKVRQLPTANELLDDKYGKEGTPQRDTFNKEAYSYYTGKIIEQARKNAHLTQSQLADRIGSGKSYISKIETGQTEPRVSTFYRIVAALGLSVDLKPV
ncbi:MAG: helix-turn-helix domain-containing protein [Prevotellaceae bacterium]|jgi:ribosome-binding protein aMBF1 (putative translation factor)|nr:helix-turn-helix domain-containing protein [Prevotellaceae bacterium]